MIIKLSVKDKNFKVNMLSLSILIFLQFSIINFFKVFIFKVKTELNWNEYNPKYCQGIGDCVSYTLNYPIEEV